MSGHARSAGPRTFLLMALVQFTSYTILTVNYRAIAAAVIPAAMVTDALAAAFAFLIIRRVSKDDQHPTAALLGMMTGGSLAAWFGIWITRTW